MGEEKSRSLTRTEFEAVMKRASELAVSDPCDGQSTLDEAEVFRIASEVGLPHKHVRRALAEMRSNENPTGTIDQWFRAPQVRGSRVVRASKEDLRHTLDRLEQGEDRAPPPASWRRWVMDQARRFRVEITGSKGD